MQSLLDIAPLREKVKVNGSELEIRGVSAEDFVALLQRFPLLQEAFAVGKFTPADLVGIAPQAIAAIIASGFRQFGNAEAEAVAADLPLGLQVELLGAIVRLTMPNGYGPFVNAIQSVLAAVGAEQIPGMTSPRPSNS